MTKQTIKYKQPIAHENGMVLLISLVVLSALMGLLVSMFELNILGYKINTELLKHQEQFISLEKAITQVQKNFQVEKLKVCNRRQHEPVSVFFTDNQPTCFKIIDKTSIKYSMTDLGEFPCLRVIKNELSYSSHHWLITAYNSSGFIQVRFVEQGALNACEEQQLVKYVSPGQISWRYIQGQPV